MITGRDIVLISSVDWGSLWESHHEMASRLATAGNRVLYVENLGVRSPRLADARRIVRRLGGFLGSRRGRGTREVAAGLHVCSPLVLPPFGGPWRRPVQRLLLRRIRRAADAIGIRDPILITYLPTDTALELIELLRGPRSIVVYACIADFAELAPRRGRLEDAERSLLGSSDLVLAQGARLTAHCEQWSERVHRIECAVDLDRFPVHPSAAADSPLESLPRPVIGYVGGLHRQLDLNLAVRLARARPEWSWVYVGPVQTPLGDLPAQPNVHLPGRVPHDELAATIERFDVGIVPYRIAPSTETVFPIKLLEYLAIGVAAVSTPLPEVERFDDEHGVVSTASAQPDAFLAAIEGELDSSGDEARSAARRQAAESRDWATQMARIGELIAAA